MLRMQNIAILALVALAATVVFTDNCQAQWGSSFKNPPPQLEMPGTNAVSSGRQTPSFTPPPTQTLRMPSTGTGAPNSRPGTGRPPLTLRPPTTGQPTPNTGYSNIRRKPPTSLRMPSTQGPSGDFFR